MPPRGASLPVGSPTGWPRGDVPTSPQLPTSMASQRLQMLTGSRPQRGTNIFLLWGLSSQLALKLTWNFRSPTTCSPACFDSWSSLKGLKCGPCMFIQHLALCQGCGGGDLWSPCRWIYSPRGETGHFNKDLTLHVRHKNLRDIVFWKASFWKKFTLSQVKLVKESNYQVSSNCDSWGRAGVLWWQGQRPPLA